MTATGVLFIVAALFIGYEALQHFGLKKVGASSGGSAEATTNPSNSGSGAQGGTSVPPSQPALNTVRPSSQPSAPTGNVANDIINWAYANAARIGVNPRVLALTLLTASEYETGLTSPNVPGARGPFSFDDSGPSGGTYGAARAAGYDPLTAQGSLDYFMNHDALISTMRQIGESTSVTVLHLFEQLVERPNSSVDASRVARGDWQAAYNRAQQILQQYGL